MILCLDTNTVVQALAQHHPFHPILDAWVAGHLTWAVSTLNLLTEDAHFAPLAKAGYKPRTMSPQQFITQFIVSDE